MRAKKILLIDDESDIRECVQLLVARSGNYEFEHASDGAEGLQKILNGNYDCVVTDIKMPGMDGVSMLKKVRAAGKNIPILFISAFADEEFEYKVVDYGAVKLINKVDIKHVAKSVKEALVIGEQTAEITATREYGEDFLKLLNNT